MSAAKPITRFLHEQTIRPDQIGEYKVIIHRSVLREWALAHPIVLKRYDLATLWEIREECIAALEG